MNNPTLGAAIAAATGWPTPATVTQGFLSGRWQRRDGTVYGAAARRGLPGPNSPVEGGDDTSARVDVPSGAPIASVQTKHPAGDL